jgi:heme/copper-type cytochrome/quinol oxidase subunit 3
MKVKPLLNVSHLPAYAFGHRSLMWWGTMGMIVIEGTVFALLIVTYFYLRGRVPHWPPHLQPPDLFPGTLNTLILLVSAAPNEWVKRAAEREDLRTVQIGLLICLAFAVAFLVTRVFEFHALHCRWDTNAYGSIVWATLGFHTTHLVTDTVDTIVLTVLMFTKPIEGRRFSDVSENSVYWYFVVGVWLPLYVVLYLAPRVL